MKIKNTASVTKFIRSADIFSVFLDVRSFDVKSQFFSHYDLIFILLNFIIIEEGC